MNALRSTTPRLRRVNKFFFGDTKPEILGLFRLVLGCYLFVSFLLFAPTAFRFFGNDAPLSLELIQQYYGPHAWTVFSFAYTQEFVLFFYLLTLLFLAAFAAGFLTPWSTLAVYLSFLSWRNGAVFIWNGGDDVQTTLLFLMTIAGFAGHTSQAFSVDALLRKEKRLTIPSWSLRLLQIQFCIIYFFNAWHKALQPMWKDGEAVHYAVQDLSWSNVDLSFLSHSPFIIALLTYATFLLLTLFPAFVWYEKTRIPMLILAATFHVVTRLLFNVFAFPVMVVYLIVFLKPREVYMFIAPLRKAS